MKKNASLIRISTFAVLLLLLVGCHSDDEKSETIHDDYAPLIVDDIFRAYCLEEFDTDEDGKLSYAEVMEVTEIDVSYSKCQVQTLTGIEHFKNLESLNCSCRNFKELSLSDLPQLFFLDCSMGKITTLTLSNLPELATLNCEYNSITKLSLSNLPQLTALNCNNNNLTELSLSDQLQLNTLYCNNNRLTTLSLSDLPRFQILLCANNELTTLSLSNLPKLTNLYCPTNKLTELLLSNLPRLSALTCADNNLTELPQQLSGFTQLSYLACSFNKLTKLPSLSALTELRELYCFLNPIREIDISANPTLRLFCGNWDENTNTGTELTVYVEQGGESNGGMNNFSVSAGYINKTGTVSTKRITTKGIPVYGVTVLDKP